MRIGILSDTHNQFERTSHAIQFLCEAGAEALIHCGDFVDDTILMLMRAIPCYFVLGNNDANSAQNLRQAAHQIGAKCLERGGIIELAGKRIATTHGHLTSEIRRLRTLQPDFLFSGHTHAAHDRFDGKLRWINPGALHRARKYTVACVNVVTDEIQWIEIPPILTSYVPEKLRKH